VIMKVFFLIKPKAALRFFFRITLPLVLLSVGACSTIIRESSDGGPSRPVDLSHVEDATPAPVVRTRAGNAKVYSVLGKTYQILDESHGYRERGMASWYGTKFHGRRTANGEVYDMYAMTGAHKTLPIPSYVRVTNVNNGRSVVVRINDRGPFHDNRILDLSYAAAHKLGVDVAGVALVEVEDVTPVPGKTFVEVPDNKAIGSVADARELYLQIGAFQQRQSAISLQSKVTGLFSEAVNITEGTDSLHRVIIGPIANEQTIPALRQRLEDSGLNKGHLVRVTR